MGIYLNHPDHNIFMKKALLALFLVSLLIGCVQRNTQENQEQKQIKVEQEEQNKISGEIQEIIDKAEQTRSYSYNYKSNIPGERQSDKFHVKMPYVKVELNEDVVEDGNRITVVYLDTSKESAVAYCKDKNQRICPEKDRAYYVNYKDYYKTLPHEWIKNIDAGKRIGYESIERKEASILELKKGKKTYLTKVIDFYGIPAVVEIMGEQYKYTDLAFNHLSDKDVIS